MGSDRADVAVVGAGPVGCVAAIALARRGQRVVLLEASPAGRRLAGEWLHPAAVELLRELDVPLPPRARPESARGFIVFPEDGSAPLPLPYPDDRGGLTCEHHELVAWLRGIAEAVPRLEVRTDVQVVQVIGQSVFFRERGSPELRRMEAPLVVGADGRGSVVRRSLGLPDGREAISMMASVLLSGVTLPHEGFGHVCLGGPGPVVITRIGADALRVCIDVPPTGAGDFRKPAVLAQRYESAVPECLRPAFRAALLSDTIEWAANQRRPRCEFGRPGLALVGDSAGHCHPLTATGMTTGFLDAAQLAKSATFEQYRQNRLARSLGPELLAEGMYRLFTRTDPASQALRQSVYHTWRTNALECARTMRLLSGDDVGLVSFGRSFLSAVGGAASARVLGAGAASWVGWLGKSVVPRIVGRGVSLL